MLADRYQAAAITHWPVQVEPKIDGVRCLAEVDLAAGKVQLHTRNGNLISHMESLNHGVLELARRLAAPVGAGVVIIDSELTAGNFAQTLAALRGVAPPDKTPTLHVFDALVDVHACSLQEHGSYAARRQRLQQAWAAGMPSTLQLVASESAHTEGEVEAIYRRQLAAGWEGVMVKNPSAFYAAGRSQAWLKIKPRETFDVAVVGAFEGTGRQAGTLGGLIVDHQGVEVRIASGFTSDQRDDYWYQYSRDLKWQAAGMSDACQLLGGIVEVKCQEELPSGSMRHPAFVCRRLDKDAPRRAA
ncbi:hypothetical protein PY254_10605 [Rhodanobacter sp. AS-Z3]|uniref:ATP-dependent DNA ligase n=1 Tax=Rhodanobacter sp. AS-Z3 TaxID=3031330 RepID=UPI00247A703D|nr:hypothetical protein [Rhodanobacter sp. AS-Z3]WEN16867.1 hypothetical protein PY254_10605 [Rhodanobacter sp. AS-Z3]